MCVFWGQIQRREKKKQQLCQRRTAAFIRSSAPQHAHSVIRARTTRITQHPPHKPFNKQIKDAGTQTQRERRTTHSAIAHSVDFALSAPVSVYTRPAPVEITRSFPLTVAEATSERLIAPAVLSTIHHALYLRYTDIHDSVGKWHMLFFFFFPHFFLEKVF